jgi:hypothetical protein
MEISPLTAEETQVVEILYRDWQDLLRCTTIDQAMERAGVAFSHEGRLRIGEFLRGDAKADALMRWEPSVYVLTNEEKLLARRILRLWQGCGTILQPGDAEMQRFDLAPDRASEAFVTLAWLGFLRKTNHGYELAPNHALFLGGLGFYYHEVVLPARNERFNTNCAPDFFIMTHPPTRYRLMKRLAAGSQPVATAGEGMSQKMVDAVRAAATPGVRSLSQSASHRDERAILNDACGWSDEPIEVVMDHGKLVEITPSSTWYLLGGGCGVNNLFRSEEALQSWLREHPQFRDREAGPLEAFLSQTS